jgi:ATP phosphoribosyltransferase regulatory subunit
MVFRARTDLDPETRARLDATAAKIEGVFGASYRFVPLPVLQPAALYLDMAGEEVRDRTYILEDPSGAELCLRADLTIPLCRRALDQGFAFPARLCSLGPVFRFEPRESALPAETLQAGVENLGAADALGADVEVLGLARKAVAAGFDGRIVAEIGDLALFPALIADLALEDVWSRRLLYAFRHPSLLPRILAEIREDKPVKSPPLISGATLADAERYVAGKLKLDAPDLVGGRTITEIAERLVDKVKLARSPRPSADALSKIETFLAIEGPAKEALGRLKALAGKTGKLRDALNGLDERLSGVRAHLAKEDELRLSTTLGRAFLYYTSLVFEFRADGFALPLAAGGRYDRLMQDLGAADAIRAVGCAVWPERLLAARSAL